MSLTLAIQRLTAPVLPRPESVRWHDRALRLHGGRLLLRGRPFSGLREQHRGEALLKRAAYRDGWLDGDICTWYPDGRLYAREHYTQGRKTGVQASWWHNGRPRYEYHFVDGQAHGRAREWHENGRLAREFRYVRGHQTGRQALYDSDGCLRSCYRAERGRRHAEALAAC